MKGIFIKTLTRWLYLHCLLIAHLLQAFWIVLLSIFILSKVKAEYDVSSYCQRVPTGTKLPSPESCNKYYTCQGNGKFVESFCKGKDVFDKDRQSCVPESLTECFMSNEQPCKGQHNIFMPYRKDCRLWYWCYNGDILGTGICPKDQVFDVYAQKCTHGTCNSVDETNACDIMPVEMFFGDIDNCAFWHKCTKNKQIISSRCPQDYIFDIEMQACYPQYDNMCTGPTQECNEIENFGQKVPHNEICSVYFICQKLFGKYYDWQKVNCPINEYFDTLTGTCMSRQKATPSKGCDRCQYSTTNWVNAVDSNCSKFLTCENGVKMTEGNCGELHAYFNEQQQYCELDDSSLDDYRLHNGACATGQDD